jgi:hypothetical protein
MTQTKKNKLADRMGSRGLKHFKEARKDPVKYTGDLPGGINNGVAKLTACVFGIDKNGNDYFRAAGTAVSPDKHDGQTVAGRPTSIFETLADTPQARGRNARLTFEDHMDHVLNELKKLGLETDELDFEDIEEAMETLIGTHFKFTTWRGEKSELFPNPRLVEKWEGVVEYEDEEVDPVDEEDEVDETEEEEEEEEVDDDTEEEDFEPEPDEHFYYKPTGQQQVECSVKKVFLKKRLVNLVNLNTNEIYTKISWDDLKEVD